MRHRKFSQRLSRPQGSRRAALRNLAIGLLRHQRIKTTKAKAKVVRSTAERLITLARQDSLQRRRQAFKILNDRAAVNRLFLQIAPLFKERTSGFSRIIGYTHRRGDGAELVFLELTEKLPEVKIQPGKKGKAPQKKKPAAAAEQAKPETKPEQKLGLPKKEKARPPKKLKPKKFLGGLRRLFKKERDSL